MLNLMNRWGYDPLLPSQVNGSLCRIKKIIGPARLEPSAGVRHKEKIELSILWVGEGEGCGIQNFNLWLEIFLEGYYQDVFNVFEMKSSGSGWESCNSDALHTPKGYRLTYYV